MPPAEDLRHNLLRLGPDGERAERFLCEAARQLTRRGEMQGEVVAYLLREALGALLKLGGEKPFDLKQSAQRVVTASKLPEEDGGSRNDLERVIGELERALGNPNEARLEDAVRIISRRRPLRGDADLLDAYLDRLEEANNGLHDRIGRGRAVHLYEGTIDVVASLFGPLVSRLASIDALLAIDSPSADDARRLLSQVGDDRHLLYFFEKVEGPGWFQALRESAILHAPAEGGWPAGPYLQRLLPDHPDLVREWLIERASEDLNTNQAFFLLRIATGLKGDVADLIADLAQGHLDSPQVEILVENYLRDLSDREIRAGGLQRLVIESLKGALGGDRQAGHFLLAARILDVAERGLAIDPEGWLPVFVYRLRELAENESTLRLQTIRPLAELRVDSRSRSALELMCGAVRAAAAGASAAGMSDEKVSFWLGKLREPLRDRLLARWLRERENLALASRLLPEWIAAEVRPSPEQLDLLRWVFEQGGSSFAEGVREALGPAPETEEIDGLSADETLPDHLRRPHNWLVAIPEAERGRWGGADRLLDERFGAASEDGVLFRVGPARFAGAQSPISVEELAAVSPLEAARRINAWKEPPERSFLAPSAAGLADAIGDVVEKNKAAWLDADPRQIVDALVGPRFIASYLGAVEKALDDLSEERVGQIVETVAGIQAHAAAARSEEVEDTDDWTYASHLGIRLIGALADRGRLADDDFELAWETVLAAVGERGPESGAEGDVLSRAINRPWSSALEAAFSLGGMGDGVDRRLLDLVDDLLLLPRPAGELARAIIATRIPWLRHIDADWFSGAEEGLLGASAPEGLGDLTFATYLEWGRPTTELLHDQHDRIAAALVGDTAEFALRHVIHGLFWELPGYAAADVCDLLADKPELFSEAARSLALALTEDDENSSGPPAGPALALWREALAAGLPADAYAGWGSFAFADRVDDRDWLELTLRTAAVPSVNLVEPDQIAERAERMATDEQALELVAFLLGADPKAWELERIGAVGLRLLRSGTGSPAVRGELRERLLERGFNEATEID
ncbi:MAG TPA: hypothetical protein VG816_09060 [Solirubrobacterales bacterium]|nr:hypothetical protein [Solirubrobacterales bacterium]